MNFVAVELNPKGILVGISNVVLDTDDDFDDVTHCNDEIIEDYRTNAKCDTPTYFESARRNFKDPKIEPRN
jgi:hypothetical protein